MSYASKIVAAFCVGSALLVAASGQARAGEPTKDSPRDEPKPVDAPREPFKSVAITANPLSLAIGRIGLNGEFLPAPHHALVINPFVQFASAESDNQKTTYSNYGGELGYRFYSGSRGANGFFVGPFVTAFSSNTSTSGGGKADASSSLVAYGAGVDLGGQHVFDFGLVLGGGVGFQYLIASSSGDTLKSSSSVKIEGVLPRFLFTAGWAF